MTVTDEAGRKRKTKMDGAGRLVQVIEDPAGMAFESDYQYDAAGNLTCVEQHGGTTGTGCSSSPSNDSTSAWRVRRFTYDDVSRLLTATNPESGTITYTYDNNGNVATKTAPKPNQTGTATVVTTYAYDALNRLTQKSYDDGSTATVKYGYDAVAATGCTPVPPALTDSNPIDRRTAMCDGSGATSWSHDPMGRVLQEKRKIGSAAAKSVSYTYNLDGSPVTIAYPSGRTVTYTPGTAGRTLSAIDQNGTPANTADDINYVTGATYAPHGALYQFANGSSISGAMTYNSRLQPLQLYFTTGTIASGTLTQLQQAACPTKAATIMGRSYNFGAGTNDNGNVISIANCRDNNRTQNFDYDALNRIKDAYTTGPNWGEAYTIDAWSNLTNIAQYAGKTLHETLNAAPATTSNHLTGFGYDAAGNMTSNGGANYTYDADNRLVTAGGVTYAYDGDGNRVRKSNGTLYWGAGPLAESDLSASAASWKDYVFFNGKRVARRDASNGSVHYFFADHLGSSSVATNATGTLPFEEDMDYYPYGGLATGASSDHYLFTGKERDTESNLDNFGARYDSSSLGRFMTPDWSEDADPVPYSDLRDPQTLNLYGYARNNPLAMRDFDGHDTERCDPDTFVTNKDGSFTLIAGHCYPVADNKSYALALLSFENEELGPWISWSGAATFAAIGCYQTKCLNIFKNNNTPPPADASPSTSTTASPNPNPNQNEKKPDSAGKMQREVEKGQAPRSVKRVDLARIKYEKPNVHFDSGDALNNDGTWKHGGRALTNAEKEWLQAHGWKLPN